MTISRQAWTNYINKLSKIDSMAAAVVENYINTHGLDDPDLIDFVYNAVTKYGEAAGACAAEWYDTVAEMSGMALPPAEVAETPEMWEVAKSVNGTKKEGSSGTVQDAAARLVKRTGADTIQNNAIRDGAQWAWIPNGDTCAFCITLASRGWQRASKKLQKNGHAEHIHANCDCTFGIRFNGNTEYQNYDPKVYADMYYGADGSTPKDKINAIRRFLSGKKKQLKNTAESGTIDTAKSSQEVTDFMKRKNWFYKCSLPSGDAFNGNTILDLSNVDLESSKALYYAHEKLFNKYPKLIGELNNVSAIPLEGDKMGQTFMGYGRGGTFVNLKTFKNHKVIEKQYKRDVENGGSPQGTTWKSVPMHELGHALDDWITHTKGITSRNGKYFSQDFMKSVLREAGLTMKDIDKNVLSTYGAKNTAECFAECFSEYMTSENPRELATIFGRRLDEFMEGI